MSQQIVTHASAAVEPAAHASGMEHADPVEIAALMPHFEAVGFPAKQVFGFVGSVALTLLALWVVSQHRLPAPLLLPAVLVSAAVQALVQLGSFMHLREARGETWQIPVLALAFVIAAGIVGFSFWIMTFKSGVS